MAEMVFEAVVIVDPDPIEAVRRMAQDFLGDDVDISGVVFVTDPDGFTIATGVAQAALKNA